jgi:hypothetical protein
VILELFSVSIFARTTSGRAPTEARRRCLLYRRQMSLRRLVQATAATAAARSSSHAPWRAAPTFQHLSTLWSAPSGLTSAAASTGLTRGHGLRSARALIRNHAAACSTPTAAAAEVAAARGCAPQRISTSPLHHSRGAAANACGKGMARRRCMSSSSSGSSSSGSGGGSGSERASKTAELAAASVAAASVAAASEAASVAAASAAAAAQAESASIRWGCTS